MSTTVRVDPITRIEGHLAIRICRQMLFIRQHHSFLVTPVNTFKIQN